MNTSQKISDRLRKRIREAGARFGHGAPVIAEFSRLSGSQTPYPPAPPLRLPFRGTAVILEETQTRVENQIARQTEISVILAANDPSYPVPEIGDLLSLSADHFPGGYREFYVDELKPIALGGVPLMWTLKGVEAGQI